MVKSITKEQHQRIHLTHQKGASMKNLEVPTVSAHLFSQWPTGTMSSKKTTEWKELSWAKVLVQPFRVTTLHGRQGSIYKDLHER